MTTTTTARKPFDEAYGGSAPEAYERYFVPAISGPLAHDLIAEAALRAGERVLDVACGTGVVARLAAERVGAAGSVAALDLNASMLDVARTVPAPAAPPIRWYESTAESMPLPDGAFDVVLCQLGLQFFGDRAAALREMHRVAARGGRVLVNVPTPTEFFGVLDSAFARRIPGAAAFVRTVFSLNDPAEVERLFRGAGFREVAVRQYVKTLRMPAAKEFLWQYVQCTPLAAQLAEADHALLESLEREVVEGWRPWTKGGGMSHEQGIIVVTAHRSVVPL
jgi:ubiquinone/menaquinone biosynthesis C-methylase UbiE